METSTQSGVSAPAPAPVRARPASPELSAPDVAPPLGEAEGGNAPAADGGHRGVRRRRLVGPLDCYVFFEWVKIFVTTSLGFPVLVIVIDLTDHLQSYLQRNIPPARDPLSYFYWVPGSMFLILPAAVLFATVFSIGAFTRHSEITAAKASGISFYRLTAPIFFAAFLAALLGLGIGELAPVTNAKHDEPSRRHSSSAEATTATTSRTPDEEGRVYKVGSLDALHGVMNALEIERRGVGFGYPTYILTRPDGELEERATAWALGPGASTWCPTASRFRRVVRFGPRQPFARGARGLMATPKNPGGHAVRGAAAIRHRAAALGRQRQ